MAIKYYKSMENMVICLKIAMCLKHELRSFLLCDDAERKIMSFIIISN